MDNNQLEVEDLLKELRLIIGDQAQQIAMLKAIITKNSSEVPPSNAPSDSSTK